MIQKVACPGCQTVLKAPAEAAGKKVRCPHCKTPVPALAPRQPAPLEIPPTPEPAFAFQDDAGGNPFVVEDSPTPRTRRSRNAPSAAKGYTYVVCGLLFVLIGGIGLIGSLVTFQGRWQGARKISSAELKELRDPKTLPDPWVTVTASKLVDTNIGIREDRSGGRETFTRFVLVPVDDHYLVVEVPADFNGTSIEGELEVWNAGIGQEALDKIREEQPEYKDKLLPVQMNATRGGAALGPIIILSASGSAILIGLGSLLYGYTTIPTKRMR